VGKLPKTFEKTRILSSMPHSGASWYWRFVGRTLRADYLVMSLAARWRYFTVRLAMASDRNEGPAPESWKTVRPSDKPTKVRWQSGDGRRVLRGHGLGKRDSNDGNSRETEHGLLWEGCKGEFPPRPTERTDLARLETPAVISDP